LATLFYYLNGAQPDCSLVVAVINPCWSRNQMRRLALILFLVTLLIVFVVLLSVSDAFAGLAQDLATEIIAAILIAIGSTILGTFFRNKSKTDDSQISAPERLRKKLLDTAKQQWVDDHLREATLQKSKFRPPLDIVIEPVAQQTDEHALKYKVAATDEAPLDTIASEILELFDSLSAATALLILGDPGSGKTTALLHLLNALYAQHNRAEENNLLRPQRFPVVFKLSSFGTATVHSDRNPQEIFENWLIDKFIEDYGVGMKREQLQRWINVTGVIYLFDGLDEVAQGNIETCIAGLNQFKKRTNVQVVVSCRREKYTAFRASGHEIENTHTLQVLDLDEEIITELLKHPDYDGLRTFLFDRRPEMLAWANKPFLLNAMMHAYSGMHADDITMTKSDKPDMPPPDILRGYVKRKLDEGDQFEETEAAYNRLVVAHPVEYEEEWRYSVRYLSWLARQLQNENEREEAAPQKGENVGHIFLIENLQPDWLEGRAWQFIYTIFSRMAGVLAIASSVGFLLSSPLDYIVIGLTLGFFKGLIDVYKQRFATLTQLTWQFVVSLVVEYAILNIAGSLIFAPLAKTAPDDKLWNAFSLSEIELIAFLNLFVVAIYAARAIQKVRTLKEDIQPVEDLEFKFYSGFIGALVGGVTVALVIGFFAEIIFVNNAGTTQELLQTWMNQYDSPLVRPFTIGGALGLFYGALIVGAMRLFDWVPRDVDQYRQVLPNAGIWRQLRKALLRGLLIGFVTTIGFGILMGVIISRSTVGFFRGAQNGIAIGLLVALANGGIDFINHFVLRVLLYWGAMAPRDYAQFLNFATRHDLLRELGGSYIFAHEYLLNYFCDLEVGRRRFVKYANVAKTLVGVGILVVIIFSFRLLIVEPLPILETVQSGNTLVIDHQMSTINTDESFCFTAGEEITIQSQGLIRVGKFVGYVPPEGTEIGVLGLPVSDTWDEVPEFPHGSLMCRLQSDTVQEADWQLCAQSSIPNIPPGFPITGAWPPRSYTFTAAHDGCLEFLVNDNEPEKHVGGFVVEVVDK